MVPDLSLRKCGAPEDCKSYASKRPEAQTPKVNLDHPNQEDTRCQISHYGNMKLQRIVRDMHRKDLKPKLLK
jgi:hypothetical protein